jgi:hypothetical protein
MRAKNLGFALPPVKRQDTILACDVVLHLPRMRFPRTTPDLLISL